MSIRNKPNYSVYPLNLSAAGFQDLPVPGTRVILLTALSGATFQQVAGVSIVSGGTVAPSCILNVQIGRALGDPIPLSINSKISVDDAFEFLRLSWPAQNGVTAFVLVDDDRAGAGVFADAPAAILGGSVALQQGGNTQLIDAGGSAQVKITAGGNTAVITAGKGATGQALQVDATKSLSPLGGSLAALSPGGIGVSTLIAAATNVNGIWLRTAYIESNAVAVGSIYADTTAPASTSDITKRKLLGIETTGQIFTSDRFLPAGVGVFLAVSAAGPQCWITYDLVA